MQVVCLWSTCIRVTVIWIWDLTPWEDLGFSLLWSNLACTINTSVTRTNLKSWHNYSNHYRKSSIKPPSQISPLPLIRPPPLFRGRKLISPPSLLTPLPSPIYSSLINDRLYQSTTTVKLRVDWSRMVYLPTGRSDLILILSCMT